MLETSTSRYAVGDTSGDYRLEELLGIGGAGEVWLATNHFTGGRAAVKFCHDTGMQQTLRNEARTLGDLLEAGREASFSPHVVRLLETHLSADPPSLVMEYCAGGDLRALIEEHGPLPEKFVAHVLDHVLAGLTWAHTRGIIHRDIKPENILLREQCHPAGGGDFPIVKVTDFGLGLPASTRALSLHRSLVGGALTAVEGSSSGTLEYMSPEQVEGTDALTPASDIYAVGIVLFELLTGRRPRGHIAPSALRGGIASGWDALFERCYAFDPAVRYPTAAAMRADLKRLGSLRPASGAPGPFVASAGAGAAPTPHPEAYSNPQLADRHRADLTARFSERLRATRTVAAKTHGSKTNGHMLTLRDDEANPLAHAQLYEGYNWPEQENASVLLWRRNFKIARSIVIILFIVMILPFTRGLLGPAKNLLNTNTILGLFVVLILIQHFLGDLIMGVDGKLKQARLILQSALDPDVILGRAQPSRFAPYRIELLNADLGLLGFLDIARPGTPRLLDANSRPLYELEPKFLSPFPHSTERMRLRRKFALRHPGGETVVGALGSGQARGLVWFSPSDPAVQGDKLLLTLALGVLTARHHTRLWQ